MITRNENIALSVTVLLYTSSFLSFSEFICQEKKIRQGKVPFVLANCSSSRTFFVRSALERCVGVWFSLFS